MLFCSLTHLRSWRNRSEQPARDQRIPLNAVQVRIIRRVPQTVTDAELAVILDAQVATITSLRRRAG